MDTINRNNTSSLINAKGYFEKKLFQNDDVVMVEKMPDVLLFDENPIDGFIGRKMLEKTGIEKPIVFDKVNDVIQHLAGLKETPDFILIDVSLPNRSGFDLYDKIKTLKLPLHHTRFFFLSSYVEFSDTEKMNQLTVNYIEKPLSPDKLANAMALP